MNFANERVDAHNNWPTRRNFKAESMFSNLLMENGEIAPLQTIPIAQSDDPKYQTCVGHLLDALDQIPYRPDLAFDHLFRVIDISGSWLFPGKGIKGVVQGITAKLMAADSQSWEKIIDTICLAMPLRTYELLAKRLLSAAPSGADDNKNLNKRAFHAFGSHFYTAFLNKFTLDISGNPIPNAAELNSIDAAKLLKLYMSGRPGTRSKPVSEPALDLRAGPGKS